MATKSITLILLLFQKVRGYTFNINSGAVDFLELDSFGFSLIPSSLVRTFELSFYPPLRKIEMH
jgi:hypothetical protein